MKTDTQNSGTNILRNFDDLIREVRDGLEKFYLNYARTKPVDGYWYMYLCCYALNPSDPSTDREGAFVIYLKRVPRSSGNSGEKIVICNYCIDLVEEHDSVGVSELIEALDKRKVSDKIKEI